jgi:hypothetical protein
MIGRQRMAGPIGSTATLVASVFAMAGTWGCAHAQQGGQPEVQEDQSLPPAGYGTLGQEDVSLQLRAPSVQIQIVPLHEGVIRLLATDTYTSLHRLVESRRSEIDDAASRWGTREPRVFMVTFFGLEPEARFTPDELVIASQSRLFRPLAIIPLSPLWNNQQLNQRETARALYVFDDGIRLLDPFTVEYVTVRTTAWEQILRVLERERTSVLARASAERNP